MTNIDLVIIQLREHRIDIVEKYKLFFQDVFTNQLHQYDINNCFKNLTDSECDEMVHALVSEFVDRHLKWVTATPSYVYNDIIDKIAFDRIRTLVTEEQLLVIRDDFYHHVIDPVWSNVRALIQPALPEDTWDMWTIRRMPHSIILQRGIDYRIMDWHQKMESGEWS